MTIRGLDEYGKMLDRLGKQAPEVSKKAVYAGASVLADEVRKRLEQNLRDPAFAGKSPDADYMVKQNRFTGDLLDSLGIAPISIDGNGNTNTKIGFDGYDRKGVPNALKARAMESGTSTLRKRPFVRPAVNTVKQQVQQAMGETVEKEISKIYAL